MACSAARKPDTSAVAKKPASATAKKPAKKAVPAIEVSLHQADTSLDHLIFAWDKFSEEERKFLAGNVRAVCIEIGTAKAAHRLSVRFLRHDSPSSTESKQGAGRNTIRVWH